MLLNITSITLVSVSKSHEHGPNQLDSSCSFLLLRLKQVYFLQVRAWGITHEIDPRNEGKGEPWLKNNGPFLLGPLAQPREKV